MDKYDRAVLALTLHPNNIQYAWGNPYNEEIGSLFIYCCRGNYNSGCLTQVKSGRFSAATSELTIAIRNDSRIPSCPEDITVESLPVFAEWQRRLDKELSVTSS